MALTAVLLFGGNGATARADNSAATISGSFADACRDFDAHSSKDISHVKITFVDGRTVKDEQITTPRYTLDGSQGDEIDTAIVKSGSTIGTFACQQTNSPPTAILEILGPCGMLGDGTLSCDADQDRSTWTWIRPGNGLVFWGCNDDQICLGTPTDPAFRGTASTDPDGDIVSWSIDFGDGTSKGGNWMSDPPIELLHQYPPFPDVARSNPIVTLTVTDSAGQTDSDSMQVVFMGPD